MSHDELALIQVIVGSFTGLATLGALIMVVLRFPVEKRQLMAETNADQLAAAESQVQIVMAAQTELRLKLVERERDAARSEAKVEKLGREMLELQRGYEEDNRKVGTAMARERDRWDAEKKALSEKVEQLGRDVEERGEAIAALNKALETEQDARRQLEQQIEALKAEYERKLADERAAREALEKRLKDTNTLYEQAKAENEGLRARLASLEEKMAQQPGTGPLTTKGEAKE